MKPCLSNLLDDCSAIKDGINAFIVACELHRTGKTDGQIRSVLDRLRVGPSKVRSAVKSAATDKYSFGCPRLEREGLCRYGHRSQCWWYERIPKRSWKGRNERDFWRYGWPGKLTSTEGMVYLAVREIETKRRIRAGSWLFISRKELTMVSGASHGWVLQCCERLRNNGLIEFKKGTQHRWYGRASEIRRIVPIPRPN